MTKGNSKFQRPFTTPESNTRREIAQQVTFPSGVRYTLFKPFVVVEREGNPAYPNGMRRRVAKGMHP